jgi:hypothetical protein
MLLRVACRVALVAVLATLFAGLLAEPSMGYTTWSGTCTFNGWSYFWPYRKWAPQPSGYHYIGKGDCKGTLNGKTYNGRAKVDNYANMKQPMSCGIGGSTYGGPVYIIFMKHKKAAGSSGKPKKGKTTFARGRATDQASAARTRKAHRRAAKASAASSSPPRDPQQPPPVPPAPSTHYPVLTAWSDEVNMLNYIDSDLWGAYRGFAVGRGGFPSDPNALQKCAGNGVEKGWLTQTYTTISPLRG